MDQYVALYLRISRDPAGRVEGVGRQEAWGRDYAARHWPGVPVRVFADNNLSADESTHRPEYEQLRKAIAAGEVAHLWAVEQSRLTRVEVHWFELASDLLAADITEIHTDRDGVVRLDEVAGIKAVLAASERRRLKRRVNDTLTSLANEGRPPGGPVFGYRRTVDAEGRRALEVDPDLAPHIRAAADMVLGGWSLSAVAREMEARGVPTRLGGRWTHSNVKGMLTAPTVAAQRVHQGEVIREGNWDPILDKGTWERLCDMLGAQHEVVRPDGTVQKVGGRRRNPGRIYLLTGGVARCGREGCGAALVARRRINHKSERTPLYFCDKDHGGCGRLGALAGEPFPDGSPGVESTVVRLLFERLRTPEFMAMVAEDDTAEARDALTRRIDGVKDRRRKLARRWARGELDDGEWDDARDELDTLRAGLVADLEALAPVTRVDVTAVLAGWAELPMPERRSFVDLYIAQVRVSPAKPGAKVFDPGRVTVEWR